MARVADFVGLTELRSMCVARAVSGLNVGNAARYLVAADELGLSDLKEQSIKIILYDYAKVVDTPGFGNLGRPHLEDLLRRDDLRVRREEEVFESLLHWMT